MFDLSHSTYLDHTTSNRSARPSSIPRETLPPTPAFPAPVPLQLQRGREREREGKSVEREEGHLAPCQSYLCCYYCALLHDRQQVSNSTHTYTTPVHRKGSVGTTGTPARLVQQAKSTTLLAPSLDDSPLRSTASSTLFNDPKAQKLLLLWYLAVMAVAAAAMAIMVKAVEAGVAHLDGEWGRRFRSLFWKVRAEVKRQVAKRKDRKQRFDFHYDPLSYALNFDDTSSAFFFC